MAISSKFSFHGPYPFWYLREVQDPYTADINDLGFAGLFFNRTNFSGIISANPLGGKSQSSRYPINCRFNKSKLVYLIQEIAHFHKNISVDWNDAIQYIRNMQLHNIKGSAFVYFDPPYYDKGALLYRYSYNDIDHAALAKLVSSSFGFNWLISYDDAAYINELYGSKWFVRRPYFDYTVYKGNRNRKNELLISNLPLPPVYSSLVQNL